METLNITETRKQLSRIINGELSVQVGVSKHQSVIMPKQEFDKLQELVNTLQSQTQALELKLIAKESEEILKSNQKRYSIVEVDAMLGRVWEQYEGDNTSRRSSN